MFVPMLQKIANCKDLPCWEVAHNALALPAVPTEPKDDGKVDIAAPGQKADDAPPWLCKLGLQTWTSRRDIPLDRKVASRPLPKESYGRLTT